MLTNSTKIKSEGDLGGQKIGLSFDQNSLAHIMSVLTDLYSDPELAVIREYSTNALDSHVEAGNPDPIQVTTPTGIFPFFVVQDFGVGLSLEDIENVYSKYGASTKRNTNEQTGMLGLGCKSALTYTGQFSLVGVKDGIKTMVSISRSDVGGTMEVIDESPTSEPNGVKVTIPVKNRTTLISKANSFYKFWAPGTVLVDGKELVHQDTKVIYDKDIRIELVPELQQDYIVMGNIAYATTAPLYSNYRYRLDHVVAYVPMGAVNFTPSRESLHYTPLTKQCVSNVNRLVEASIVKAAEDEIATAPTHGEAAKAFVDWTQKLGNAALKMQYKGEKIPNTIGGFHLSYNPGRYRTKVSTMLPDHHINLSSFFNTSNVMLVLDYPNKDLSKTQRQKLDEYCGRHAIRFASVFLADKYQVKDAKWIDCLKIVTWEDITREVKIIRKSQPKRKDAGYEFWDSDSSTWEETDDLDDVIIYCNQPERRKFTGKQFKALEKYGTLVCLPKNRWPKFQRDYPEALHVSMAIEKEMRLCEKLLTSEDEKLIMGGSGDGWLIEKLLKIKGKILDPEVLDKLESYNTKRAAAVERYKRVSSWASLINAKVKDLPAQHMFDGYPLLYNIQQHHYNFPATLNHVAIYMNAVYSLHEAEKSVTIG